VGKKGQPPRRFKTDGKALFRSRSMIFLFYVWFTAVLQG